MKILITGVKGQLGNAIQTISGNYPSFEFLLTDVEELDITSRKDLDAFFSKNQPGICINCAAYTAVDKAEEDIDTAYLLNSQAVRLLGDITRHYGTKLIHISTDYVFNGQMWEPYKEMDEPNANSVYGQSKAEGELALKANDHAMIVRTSWLYSEFGKNFFKTMLSLMQTREELRIVSDQVGTPTYAGDLARALLNIVKEIEKGNFIPGIYHYSNEGVASWYDFAWEIARISGSHCKVLPIETHEYPLPAPRPPYSVLNKGRIKQVYGVKVPYWREGLEECYTRYFDLLD
jgi:dTDP-4-dehydrorhamnose reductase